jgi:uncharacterized protein YuzE
MKILVSKEDDALYIRLDDSDIEESEEIQPGIILDYNRDGTVVGLELLNISKNINPDRLRSVQLELA